MDIGMKNYMEDIITDKMPSVLEVLAQMGDICECERCNYDRLAYALNKTPPKYVVTRKGQMYAKLSSLQVQFDADVITSIMQAVAIVKANPRHED